MKSSQVFLNYYQIPDSLQTFFKSALGVKLINVVKLSTVLVS